MFSKTKVKITVLFCTVLMTVCMCMQAFPAFADTNTSQIIGGDFESDTDFWTYYIWNENVTEFSIDNSVFKSGANSFLISSESDNDARIIQSISVKPSTYYTVTAYIKTENVLYSDTEHYRLGATISVLGLSYTSEPVYGTCDWVKNTFSFMTAYDMSTVDLCFTLGGYSALNSGKAWFDDITIEEVSERPSKCYNLAYKDSGTEKPQSGHWAGYELTENPDQIKWIAFAFVWFFVLAALAISFAETGDINGSEKNLKRTFVFLIVGAFLFRIAVGLFVPAFTYDIGLFKFWAWHASTDLFNMYSGAVNFLDYPPLYLYMLAPLGGIANALQGVMGGAVTQLIIKLPSIIADMVTSVLLYKFAKRYLDIKWAVVIGLFYAINPAVWINSAAWGQVDSILASLVLIELICIANKKWAGAGIFFALMVLLKPHGIIFTPAIGLLLLFELIQNKNWKPIAIAVPSGILTCAVLLLPFYIRTNFQNPTWILDLYMGTIDSYPYATFNGFNFWAMLGKNLTNVNNIIGGLTVAQWGMLAIGFAVLVAIVFFAFGRRKKVKCRDAMPAIVSLVLITTVFTFAHKMHERYMFTAIVLALICFVQSKDKWFIYHALIFSALIFFNTYMIYNFNVMYTYPHPDFGDKIVAILGTLEFISYIAFLITTIKTVIFNKLSLPKSLAIREENNK